jgi:hypothetical protein
MKMNKYQEALNKIRNIVLDESGDGYYTQRYLQDFYSNACGTLQELVDKVDSFEWIPFTFDEEGVLNCELPDVDEEILVSDGDSVWQDTWREADEGYELFSGIEIEDLAWRQLPKPYEENQNENNC